MAISDIPSSRSILVMLSDNCCCPCYTFEANTKDKARLSAEELKDIIVWAANAEPEVPELFFLTEADEPLDSSVASVLEDMSEQVVTPLLPVSQQELLGIPFSINQTVVARSLGQAVTLANNISGRPIILHIERNEIGRLAESLLTIQDFVGKIRLCLRDIHLLEDHDIETYEQQLAGISDVALMKQATGTEGKLDLLNLRVVSWTRKGIARCPAGAGFVVIGPDSRIYPCPAFYYAGWKYSIESISDITSGFADINWNLRQCSICGSIKCPGCPFLESSQLTGREKICRVYEAENRATENLMPRVARSGYLFDCLRTLKTRDCATKSQDEGGGKFVANRQVYEITFDEFTQALCDLKLAAESVINKAPEGDRYGSILSRWLELQEIPSVSQRSIFRRRVYELLAELRRLINIDLVTSSSENQIIGTSIDAVSNEALEKK